MKPIPTNPISSMPMLLVRWMHGTVAWNFRAECCEGVTRFWVEFSTFSETIMIQTGTLRTRCRARSTGDRDVSFCSSRSIGKGWIGSGSV